MIIFVKKMSIDYIILNMVLSSNLTNLNLYGKKGVDGENLGVTPLCLFFV